MKQRPTSFQERRAPLREPRAVTVKRLAALALSALLVASASSLCTARAAVQSASLSEEEYAVYAALLTGMFTKDPTKTVVLVDETRGDRLGADMESVIFKSIVERLAPLSQAAVDDYRKKNEQTAKLSDHDGFKFKHVLLEKRLWDEIFKDGAGGWDDFYQKFSGSIGYVRLSRIGFDRKNSQAFVYVEHGCGGLCGRGTYVLLFKEKGATGEALWKIHKQGVAWIS